MNVRLPSVVVLGSLALTSCFFAPAPPPPRHSALGPSSSYRGDGYEPEGPGRYRQPDDHAYDAPPPMPEPSVPRDPEPPVTPPPSGPTSRKEYPTAERTTKPDQVLSPYEPYNVIDVAGFKSGQLAKDPSNGKIFRIP